MAKQWMGRPAHALAFGGVLFALVGLTACGGSTVGQAGSAATSGTSGEALNRNFGSSNAGAAGASATSGVSSSGEAAAGGAGAAATSAPFAAAATTAMAAATSAPVVVAPEPAGMGITTAATSAPGVVPEAAEMMATAVSGDAVVAETSLPSTAGGATGSNPYPSPDQAPPLKAGEIDDNADFAAYLDYLRRANQRNVRPVDVQERLILTVANEKERPVLDARVQLFDGDQQVFEGRTYASGQTIIFPRALGLGANTTTFRVVVAKGDQTVEDAVRRDEQQHTVVLPNASTKEVTQLDVLFLLDATGSMGDEIAQIQRTIVSIAERIDGIEPRPELRFGLVAYRDRGEEYVTHSTPFTPDVNTFRDVLLRTRADGGGDEPESLNEGLHAAVQGMPWRTDAVRLVFLVADAPPHIDYADDFDYVQEAQVAVQRGIKVYSIAASNSSPDAEYVLRQLAQQTLGHFIFLTYQPGQNSGPPGETTTLDVDPKAFTVERLDDIVVQVVQRELAQAQGQK